MSRWEFTYLYIQYNLNIKHTYWRLDIPGNAKSGKMLYLLYLFYSFIFKYQHQIKNMDNMISHKETLVLLENNVDCAKSLFRCLYISHIQTSNCFSVNSSGCHPIIHYVFVIPINILRHEGNIFLMCKVQLYTLTQLMHNNAWKNCICNKYFS